jgi:6,7-dimethyl-8-ribityllumazine synthase
VLEIPAAIKMAIQAAIKVKRRPFDAYLALGCVIRGETTHYNIVCNESARGMRELILGDRPRLRRAYRGNDEQAWGAPGQSQEQGRGGATSPCMTSSAVLASRTRE